MNRRLRGGLLASFILATVGPRALSQSVDHTEPPVAVSGAVSVTTKGISTIPSFTLGKPAAIFDLSLAKRGLSFDPQFRFSLDGKPWSFLFWGRYKLIDGERLRVTVGAHPALSFRSIPMTTNGVPREVIVARRYLAGELAPSYSLTRNLSVGTYYLYSYGVETDVVRHTHFLAMRANLTGALLSEHVSLRFAPQLYYLKTADRDGLYLNSGLTLSRRNLPLSISTTANKPIRTTVIGGEQFLWNLSAHYAIR